jgi:hypothetical protein
MPPQTRPATSPDQPQTPPDPTGQLLVAISRGETEQLRVSLDEFQGHAFVNVRVWAQDRNGGWWPVRGKGVSVRIRELNQVIEALIQAAGKTGQG